MKKRRNLRFVNLILLGCTILLAYVIERSFKEEKKLLIVANGLQTCMIRVGQKHMAKLLGEVDSISLTSQFALETEECFGEAIHLIEDNFESLLRNAEGNDLNTLASEVHWFYQKLSMPTSNTDHIDHIDHFEKIELLAALVSEQIDEKIEEISERTFLFKIIFLVLSPIALTFSFMGALAKSD